MREITETNYLSLRSVPELCGRNFFIPSYQRGFRWQELQVRQLVDDLCKFFRGKDVGDFYCLQSVVVKEMSAADKAEYGLHSDNDADRWYEVIDGQQRLTSIRLLLALSTLLDEDKTLSFTIHYATRPKLGGIFDALRRNRGEYNIYVDNADQYQDIDSWHILCAAQTIMSYFLDRSDIPTFKGSFYEHFTHRGRSREGDKEKSVQVIWYELRDGTSPTEMFLRLNDKKISLNNAELIRALFLSDGADYPCDEELLRKFDKSQKGALTDRERTHKQQHIIEMWDIIERELRQDSFWAFVSSDSAKRYSCRIEYLFDLLSGKDDHDKDDLFTFLHFTDMLKEGDESVKDLWQLWLKVEEYFSYLTAWYDDIHYYHTIGYLITIYGARILRDLLKEASSDTKEEFDTFIRDKIKESIHTDKDSDIFSYTYDGNGVHVQRVLLLHNIVSMEQQREFFPFDRYKGETWNIEHIHAQNSENLSASNREEWRQWVDENLTALENLLCHRTDDSVLTTLIQSLTTAKGKIHNRRAVNYTTITHLFDEVLRYYDTLRGERQQPSVINGLSNLCLLPQGINIAISNSIFEVKRQLIIRYDAQGRYLPYCSRRVFLKYYNSGDAHFATQQTYYWSESDRINYENNIKSVLTEYL